MEVGSQLRGSNYEEEKKLWISKLVYIHLVFNMISTKIGFDQGVIQRNRFYWSKRREQYNLLCN